jgi:FOG: Ankyrin repeat
LTLHHSVVDNIVEINTSTINDNDNNGNAPLHRAAESGNHNVIRFLMKSGASVNDKNALGQTSLEIAASNGHTEAAKALISGGGLFLKMTCDFFVKSIILL